MEIRAFAERVLLTSDLAAKLQPLQLKLDRLRKDVDELKRERGTPEASAGRETEKINPEE